jgi:hypothetical protein
VNNQKLRRVDRRFGPMLAEKVVAAMAVVPKAHVEKVSAATVSAAMVSAAMVSAATVSAAMVSAAIDDPAAVVADEIAKTTVAVESVAIVVPSLARPAASHREPTLPKQSVAGPISVRRVRRDRKVRYRRHSPAKRVAPTSRHAAVVPSVVPNSPLSATSLGTSVTNSPVSLLSAVSLASSENSVATSRESVATSPDESSRAPIQQPPTLVWSQCAAVERRPRRQAVHPSQVNAVVDVVVVVADVAAIAHSPVRTAAAPSRKRLTSPIRRASPQAEVQFLSTALVALPTQARFLSTALVALLTQARFLSTTRVAPPTQARFPSLFRPVRADQPLVAVKTCTQTPRAQLSPI